MGDYVVDPYPHAKFHKNTITPFRPTNTRKFASSDSASFFWGSSVSLQPLLNSSNQTFPQQQVPTRAQMQLQLRNPGLTSNRSFLAPQNLRWALSVGNTKTGSTKTTQKFIPCSTVCRAYTPPGSTIRTQRQRNPHTNTPNSLRKLGSAA